jgi:hypothetical protein
VETDGHSMPRRRARRAAWRGRSRWRLLRDVIGGVRQKAGKLRQLVSLLSAYLAPLVRGRLGATAGAGHRPTFRRSRSCWSRARSDDGQRGGDKLFYRARDPVVFHNLRRFISGPRPC